MFGAYSFGGGSSGGSSVPSEERVIAWLDYDGINETIIKSYNIIGVMVGQAGVYFVDIDFDGVADDEIAVATNCFGNGVVIHATARTNRPSNSIVVETYDPDHRIASPRRVQILVVRKAPDN